MLVWDRHVAHRSISYAVSLAVAALAAFAAPLALRTMAAEPAPAASGYGRSIVFSDRTWLAKTGVSGPGPNRFSDAADNVWVDTYGRLHVRITHRDGDWYCPEVVATESLGYGTYRFEVEGLVGDLDPNVVLGLFTWSDDPAYDHRELDIELARWGNPFAPNGQFTVEPNTPSVRHFTFEQPAMAVPATFVLAWRSDRAIFQSLVRDPVGLPDADSLVAEQTFADGIPAAGGEHARINLWLHEGRPPTDGAEVEAIIRRFDFTP
jgi:hypothetical protein